MKQEKYPENLYVSHFIQDGVIHPHLYVAGDLEKSKSVKYIRADLVPKMRKHPMIYKCFNCGSTDIEVRKWVNINTNEILDECDECEVDKYWCPNCDGFVRIKVEARDENL